MEVTESSRGQPPHVFGLINHTGIRLVIDGRFQIKTTLRSNRKTIFTELINKEILSPDSVSCLIETLDPFHDTTYKYVGLPDSRNDHSVIQCVKKTFSVAKPPEITGVPWDFHICTMPERNTPDFGPNATCPMQVTSLNEEGLMTENPAWGNVESYMPLAPIVMTYVPGGAKTFPKTTADVPGQIARRVINLNNYFSGSSRIIGGGIEVHNVTPTLTKTGTCTVYRQPQVHTVTSGSFVDRATRLDNVNFLNFIPPPVQTIISKLPPATADDALLLPHSKQWDAGFGSYQVFTTDFSAPDVTGFGIRHFGYGDFDGGQSSLNAGDGTPSLAGMTYGLSMASQRLNIIAATAGRKSTTPVAAPLKLWPVDTTGAFYTGLGADTVLTVTCIFIIETFPSYDSQLVTLAAPPPSYDPNFFRLYKEIALTMPPGVMVAENASGDWWEKVIDMVGDAATHIPGLGILAKPIASAVKMGVNGMVSHKAAKEKALIEAGNASRANTTYTNPKAARKDRSLEQLKVTRPVRAVKVDRAKEKSVWKQLAKFDAGGRK